MLKAFDHIAARFSFRTVAFIAKYAILFGIEFIQVWIFEIGHSAVSGCRPRWNPRFDTISPISLGLFVDIERVFKRGLVLPHVVAGENLAFFPAGVYRRCGALL